MVGIIYTGSSSRRTRKARKPSKAALEAARAADAALKDKWANVPKFAGKYELKGKAKPMKVKPCPKPVLLEPKPKVGKYDVGVGALPPQKTYTGNLVKGIAVMHKSCLQPIFTDEEAKDSAKMRR